METTQCEHKRWSVSLADKVYHGHCDICGEQVKVAILINASAQELQSLVEEFSETLKQLLKRLRGISSPKYSTSKFQRKEERS